MSNIFINKLKYVLGARKSMQIISEQASYYPDKPRKSKKEILKDLKKWFKMYHEIPTYYNMYGSDIKGADPFIYQNYKEFMKIRDKKNFLGKTNSQIPILQDKFVFYKYMKSFNLPVAEVFCFYKNGKFYDEKMNELDIKVIESATDYFIKETCGLCGDSVKHIKNYEELKKNLPNMNKGNYIFQKTIIQSDELNALNPHAINTLRLVTINNNGKIELFAKALRIGTKKSGNIDNFSKGAIACGILDNGYLKSEGKMKNSFNTNGVIFEHPDTGIVFADYKVPQYEEAVELVKKAHKCFYSMFSIGWDIAISAEGPVFIEGNDNWGGTLIQACDRPIKKEWTELKETGTISL